jgi:hypothetical protein
MPHGLRVLQMKMLAARRRQSRRCSMSLALVLAVGLVGVEAQLGGGKLGGGMGMGGGLAAAGDE